MFSQDRQRWDAECRLVENVFPLVILSSYATDHLSKKRLRAVVCEHVFKLRTHLLAVITDSIDESLIALEVSERARQVMFVRRESSVTSNNSGGSGLTQGISSPPWI